ncbi:DUF541 domain-containing protein [Acetobacter musti]|uniref:DUF541 domain-containing protein n=1 Tax=Acetobacter musti TaxID=864732 RepID=A0ABX0JRN0_9PROT|nr:SIMPL domain-containing protein [Acetobacter musti]NHN85982.1 DUF541 domain-containing protein [Acetobacter musti]
MRHPKLAVVVTSLCFCFSTAIPAVASPDSSDDGTKLHISGSGSAEASPDLIIATLTARSEASSAVRAQSETNEMMHKAMMMAQQVGNISSSAGSYFVSQTSPANNMPKNWEARQTISIKSKNADTLLPLVGRLQSSGLLLEGIDWSLSDDHRKVLTLDAEKLATQDMLRRADGIASALSMKVATIVDVTVDEAMYPRPVMFMAKAAAAPMSTPDSQKVTATVRATIILRHAG